MHIIKSVAPPEYWDELYQHRKFVYDEDEILFKDLFARYLRPGGTCFEVGCYPGGFLIYLGKMFGYTVGGIDTTPAVTTAMPEFIRTHSVAVGDCVNGDFLTYRTDRQYDVVCSFGFVEHFLNYREIIRRHVDLVKPGGTLVISCPNFRGLQEVYRRAFDATNLRRHVLASMDFKEWEGVLSRCDMRVIHRSYYRTCELWRAPGSKRQPFRDRMVKYLIWLARRVDARVTYPNRFTSPYMILFARKTEAGGHNWTETGAIPNSPVRQ